MSNILYVVDSYFGSQWYRAHCPGLALKARGHQVVLDDRYGSYDLEWADVVVFDVVSDLYHLEAISWLKSQGKLTVYDIDDDFWNIRPENPTYAAVAKKGTARDIEMLLAAVDLVTCPSPVLSDIVRGFNDNVLTLPIMLPDEWTDLKRGDRGDRITIGWAGSSSHRSDFPLIEYAVLAILDKYEHVDVKLIGATEEWLGPHERITVEGQSQSEDFPPRLLDFDIGLIPVDSHDFNRAKTDIKFLEYGAAGIAPIASDICTYDSMVDGVSGIKASTPEQWYYALERLVVDSELRKRIAAGAHDYAMTRLMKNNVNLWESAYHLTRHDIME